MPSGKTFGSASVRPNDAAGDDRAERGEAIRRRFRPVRSRRRRPWIQPTRSARSVRRSRTIARMTIASPASNAAPTSTLISARSMSAPRPGASMRAVMTTIERAIMIVWLTPRPIVRRASGSWTLRRTCRRVEPSETAASTVSAATPRMPRAVIRIAGGIA